MTVRFYTMFRNSFVGRYGSIGLITISVIFSLYTLWLLGNDIDGQDDDISQFIIIDVILLVLIVAMLFYRFYNIFFSKSDNFDLQKRMVALFSVLALVPTVLIAIFALVFFNFGLKTWFSERVSGALYSSRVVAEAYLQEHQNAIVADALAIARSIDDTIADLNLRQDELEQFLLSQGVLRDLTEMLVFDTVGRVYGRYGLTAALELEPLSYSDLTKAEQGEVVLFADRRIKRVRALIRLNSFANTYMFIGRFFDPKVIGYIDNTNATISEYELLEQSRDKLQISFTFVFVLVVLMLLTIAVWMGLGIAHTLSHPIRSLLRATYNIQQGRYGIKIKAKSEYQEIKHLIKSFNNMSQTIHDITQGLQQANRDIEDRSQFIETLLSDIRTGIISTDTDGTILLVNKYGAGLLHQSIAGLVGESIGDMVPEFAPIIETIVTKKIPFVGEVVLPIEWKIVNLLYE